MPELTLDGRRIAYGDAGRGRPLVLVHGSPGDGRAWTRVARHLPGFRLFTPDLPGYGGSAPLPHGGTAAMARAVAAVIEAAGAPAYLVGHSYGGNVALHAALAAKGRVTGLLLLEPVFFRALALTVEREPLDAAAKHFADYVRRVEAGDFGAVSRMIDFWFGEGAFRHLPAPVQSHLRAEAPKNAADVKASFAEALSAADLAGFDRPVLVAYGTSSPPLARTIASALAELLPDADASPLAGATHAMLDTHAGAVAALIKVGAAVARA